jgi:hypothetical protein
LTVAIPPTNAGDLIVVAVSTRSSTGPGVTGFTQITGASVTNDGPNPDLILRAFAKVAVGNETSAAVTYTGTAAAFVLVYRCVNATTPIDGNATTGIDSGSNFDSPAVTTSVANTLVVNIIAGDSADGGEVQPPSVYTQRAGAGSYATAVGPQFLSAADVVKSTAGAQAGSEWHKSGNTNPSWAGVSFALRR